MLFTPEKEEPVLGTQRRLLPALAVLLGVALERESARARRARGGNAPPERYRQDGGDPGGLARPAHAARDDRAGARRARERRSRPHRRSTGTALLETIRAEHVRLKRLVENLLDLSRIQAGAAAARPELWTAEELVAQALDELRARSSASWSRARRPAPGARRRSPDPARARERARERPSRLPSRRARAASGSRRRGRRC